LVEKRSKNGGLPFPFRDAAEGGVVFMYQ
jgi:hypothetical protein